MEGTPLPLTMRVIPHTVIIGPFGAALLPRAGAPASLSLAGAKQKGLTMRHEPRVTRCRATFYFAAILAANAIAAATQWHAVTIETSATPEKPG